MNTSNADLTQSHRRTPVISKWTSNTPTKPINPPTRTWTVLTFGKHTGLTLPQVLFTDPDWFFWAIEKKIIEYPKALIAEAALLNAMGRNIRIPSRSGQKQVAEYFYDRTTGKFSHFKLVKADQPLHPGGSRTTRNAVIDLSVVRESRGYDKLGYKHFLSCLRTVLLGSKSARMTKKRAEAFFDNPVNFTH